LGEFRSALQLYRVPQSEEIVFDVKNHISEAMGSGKSPADVIAALGLPDVLARAYAMELLLNPPKDSRATATVRLLKILSLVIAGGFLSLCITLTLAVLGLTLIASGPALVAGGVLQSMGEHPSWINMGPLSPLAVISIGPVVSIAGCGVCLILWRYAQMTARTLRKLLPASRL
jgi:uncharacterized membrane protein